MSARRRTMLIVWIAIKLALLMQFAAPVRDFVYEGF